MRSKKAIALELWKLEQLKQHLPSGFFSDNQELITVEIETIRNKKIPSWVWDNEDQEEPNIETASSALEALDWVLGKTKTPPSENWEELLEFRKLPVNALEAKIGKKAKEWEGFCSEIAHELRFSGLKEGAGTTEHYGHWNGPISTKSVFAGRSFTHHAWLQKGDIIIDPTRWVFEGVEPYIYIGKNDFYDDGGQQMQMHRKANAPQPQGKPYISRPTQKQAQSVLQKEGITQELLTLNQAAHLANLPPKAYPGMTEVYNWLAEHKLSGLIPLDFRRIAQQ